VSEPGDWAHAAEPVADPVADSVAAKVGDAHALPPERRWRRLTWVGSEVMPGSWQVSRQRWRPLVPAVSPSYAISRYSPRAIMRTPKSQPRVSTVQTEAISPTGTYLRKRTWTNERLLESVGNPEEV
jgi:hypothetical protein